jgi:hypothetical protein
MQQTAQAVVWHDLMPGCKRGTLYWHKVCRAHLNIFSTLLMTLKHTAAYSWSW